MICYLDKHELGRCRTLWTEAFPNDSEEFKEYYFNNKIRGSRVLAKEDGSGDILTMIHLNPYEVKVGDKLWKLDYIVGVATAAHSQGQGHMRDALTRMLLDMNHAGAPFCYLMPASPDIYKPFGFTYIFDQPLWKLKTGIPESVEQKEIRLDAYGAEFPGSASVPEELGGWINSWLEDRFQVYAVRTQSYLDMLQAELDSENGHVYGWFDKGRLTALEGRWGLDRQEQRFLYCLRDKWLEPADPANPARPAIMARITDIKTMMQAVTVNKDCLCKEMEVALKVHDSLIPGNDGLWKWRLDAYGSSLQKAEPAVELENGGKEIALPADVLSSTEVLDVTIEQLASWIFGYSELEDPPFWCRYVRPLEGVFLDEVV